MKDREQNQLDAAQVTYDYLTDPASAPIWTPLEAFGEGVAKVEGSINILHTLIQIQGGKTTGITANKKRLRISLATRLINLAKTCLTYGKLSGNDDLVAQANALNSAGEIEDIKDGLLADRAQALYDKAAAARDADATNAAKYGLKTGADDKLFAPLQSAITAYSAVVQSPQSAINRRANATGAIEDELRRMQSVLKDELDNLVVQFQEEHPDFVTGYRNARKIINRGGGTGDEKGKEGGTSNQPAGK